jgi:hypothetical protein
MKTLLLNIILATTCLTSFAQKYPKTLVDSFCNSTIEYYYTEFAKPIDSLEALTYKPRSTYILKSCITPTLRTSFNDFTVYYLTQQEALEKICLTKSKTGALDKIAVTELKDTINVDIGGWSIRVTKVKFKKGKPIPIHSTFAASCGGTLGYIPTCRFVFDKITNSWTRYTWQQTANAIMKSRQRDYD